EGNAGHRAVLDHHHAAGADRAVIAEAALTGASERSLYRYTGINKTIGQEIEVFGALQKPHVLVLGLGESGLAMARWCGLNGCR
ncbi:hypothetical protein AB4142_35665, partial [Variovorax sp. 2RAF20]